MYSIQGDQFSLKLINIQAIVKVCFPFVKIYFMFFSKLA